MSRIRETTRALPFHPPAPLTNLPLIYPGEHLFPFANCGDTAAGEGDGRQAGVLSRNPHRPPAGQSGVAGDEPRTNPLDDVVERPQPWPLSREKTAASRGAIQLLCAAGK